MNKLSPEIASSPISSLIHIKNTKVKSQFDLIFEIVAKFRMILEWLIEENHYLHKNANLE